MANGLFKKRLQNLSNDFFLFFTKQFSFSVWSDEGRARARSPASVRANVTVKRSAFEGAERSRALQVDGPACVDQTASRGTHALWTGFLLLRPAYMTTRKG